MLVNEADVLLQAEGWLRSGRRVAIATVINTSGSTPTPLGSHLAVEESGLFLGSVSSGCIEGEVITAALDVIEGGEPKLLEFGIDDGIAWRAGLTCGGRIEVFITRLQLDLLSALNRACSQRRLCALVTPLDGSETWLYQDDEGANEPPRHAFEEVMRSGKSGVVEHKDRRFFIDVQTPSRRLIIIGAVHIAQALATMASIAGFDVVIIDPRTAFAAEPRFPNTCVLTEWPDSALPVIGLDAYTAIAALSHDSKIDDQALCLALASDCFYVGALGSKASHARRIERLNLSGVAAEAIASIHAPIGLDIGALSPADIAVAILGEIILAQGKKPLRSIRVDRASFHPGVLERCEG